MANEHRRSDRVAEAIREEVARFLTEDVKDPRIRGLVTVTGVDVTRDLRHAKVFVSVLGSEVDRSATFDGLASVAAHLRARLGRALRLRLAPEVVFREDESVARAARIESLLEGIRQDAPPAAPDDAPPAAADAPADLPGAAPENAPENAPEDARREDGSVG